MKYKFVFSKPIAEEFKTWQFTWRLLRTPYFTIGFNKFVAEYEEKNKS